MFTGLIETLGTVRELRRGSGGASLSVACALSDYLLGESIAVNGACLTLIAHGQGAFRADVSPETLDCTTLSALQPGARVNLERALRLGDRLGGHLVSGHIDTVAVLTERRVDGNAIRLSFSLPAEHCRFLVAKGSVAIDGISLTVNQVTAESFSVAIIPHTLAHTTLAAIQSGQRVNIETDLLAKYVQRLFPGQRTEAEAPAPALGLDFLAKHGFL